jgi:hypothetical protein
MVRPTEGHRVPGAAGERAVVDRLEPGRRAQAEQRAVAPESRARGGRGGRAVDGRAERPAGRTRVEGVPNWFHATSACSDLASDRCAAVGAMLPVRTSSSEGRTIPGCRRRRAPERRPRARRQRSAPTRKFPAFACASPPKDGTRAGGRPRRAAFIHSGMPGSRRGGRHRARARELQRLWREGTGFKHHPRGAPAVAATVGPPPRAATLAMIPAR